MDMYDQVRNEIKNILPTIYWDDSCFLGPVFLRLSWHASGTYDAASKTGGSNGATMRFSPEKDDPENAGLAEAQKLLEPIKQKYPSISYADLWTLAGVSFNATLIFR
jgi:catalase (peroxidase I)